MRRLGPPSEIRRLAEPLGRLFDWTWQHMHWWIAVMAVLYSVSGVTVIKQDEVAVILRWGRLVGTTPALQQHGPGLLFAFPHPIDQVVRVQTKHVWEVPVNTLAPGTGSIKPAEESDNTLDPLTEGYALTGDQNIVQANMVARYRVRDPGEWAFYGPKAEDILRVEVTSAMVRSLGEMAVDRVLSDGRVRLLATVTRRTQAGLDAAHSGLELSSLELVHLAPPQALAADFDAVQSAFIQAQTQQSEAKAYAESETPKAKADANEMVQAAQASADSALAKAKGEAAAFGALDAEYRANPGVVRERLYRDAVDKAISTAGMVRWIPPSEGGNYHGFRITLPLAPTSGATTGADTEEGEP
jgi:modulator of FtsH protease HflK